MGARARMSDREGLGTTSQFHGLHFTRMNYGFELHMDQQLYITVRILFCMMDMHSQ